jgi:tetratricopeptide (TPR) repeat protein
MFRPTLITLVFLAILPLAGCNKPGTAPAANGAGWLTDLSAVDLYNAGRYTDALDRAEKDMPKATGRERDVAQLTAGLSAQALNKIARAESYLGPLADSSDPQIAGRAETGLAQIADKKGDRRHAADLYKRAAAHLQDHGPPPKQPDSVTIKKTTPVGPFAIQVGAFSSRTGAAKKVIEMRPKTIRVGLGSPRIVPDVIAGKPGFSVQVGIFMDRSDAMAARAKLGENYMIVNAE